MMGDVVVDISFTADPKDAAKVIKDIEKLGKKGGEKSGKNFAKGFSKESKKGFDDLERLALKAIGVLGTLFAGKEIIAASIRQQDAVNNLNASLAQIGEFSAATSKDLQAFASQLQSVSTFGDEAILENIAFAQSLGATAEQSKVVAAASADLAAALGIDLQSATRNVAKTLGGYAGELGEVIPELKSLTTEQLQAGEGVKLLADQFAGRAAAQTRTFGGALSQLKNSFGDLLENIGDIVTKSPVLVDIFRFLSQSFANVGTSIRNLNKDGNLIKNIVIRVIDIARAVNGFLIPPLVRAGRIFNILKEGFLSGFNLIAGGLAKLAGKIASFVGIFDDDLAESLNAFGDEALADFENNVDSVNQSLSNFFDPVNAQEKTAAFLDSLRQVAVESKEPLTELSNNFKSTLNKTVTDTKNTSKQLGQILNQSLAGAVSGGIQTIVNAVAAGQDAFKAFGNFVLTTVGDLAIKLGETLVLAGIGIESLKSLKGAAAIAAGAGLIAVGALIKAAVSGSGTIPSAPVGSLTNPGGGGVANAGFTGEADTSVTETQETQEPSQSVSVVIQGDVLDSDETGLRIVEILNKEFDSGGSTLVNGNFV